MNLQAALTAMRGFSEANSDARMRNVLGAVFTIAETVVEARSAGSAREQIQSQLRAIHAVRDIVFAAIDRDVPAALAAVSNGLAAAAAENERYGRALRLIAALATYGDAVASDDGDSTSRRDLLEAIADEFTNRTARRGDTIVSIGGTFGINAGPRTGWDGGEQRWALSSPLTLRLGLSIYHVPERPGRPGFFLELSPIDIGQYVSFTEGVVVRTPDPVDAISPTIAAGIGFGTSMPGILALYMSYSPSFQFSENDRKGAFQFGLTVGFNVPVFDLN